MTITTRGTYCSPFEQLAEQQRPQLHGPQAAGGLEGLGGSVIDRGGVGAVDDVVERLADGDDVVDGRAVGEVCAARTAFTGAG
ncbi:hypothetical protein [Rhodococcus opacus]|uniref:hypothetical protein n=1 Tax=Rhodococcus opacus TaxID=37919 RepID=UPI003D6634FB